MSVGPRIFLCTIALLALLAGERVSAQEALPTEAEGTNQVAAVDIMTLRDPFWPVGWRPPNFGKADVADTGGEVLQWDAAGRLLSITGLSKKAGGGYLAIIKGAGVVEAGDTLAVRYQGLTYKWRIKKITNTGIIRERGSVSR